MTSGEVRVETEDLRAKAGHIEGISWSSPAVQVPLISPDALVIASVAVTNLANNADMLWSYQEYGRLEGLRLAESLNLVAGAYDRVDQNAMANINAGGDPVSAPEMPGVNALPTPAPPIKAPIPKGQSASDHVLVEAAEQALHAGDQAASLRAAAQMWRQNASSLAATAQGFEVSTVNWEGEAADAAYRKFNDYRAWLITLSDSWNRLAGEADRIAQAHVNAVDKHTPIYDEYMQLQERLLSSKNATEALPIANRMAELQRESEEVRWEYASEGQPYQVEPEDPPSGVAPTAPVTANGDPRQPAGNTPENAPPGSPSGEGPQAPGGQPPTQGAPTSPEAASPMSQSGGQPSGGSPSGGGAPSGGGSPSGGSPGGMPGGLPGGGKGEPKLPTDPSLRPAAAHAGGGAGAGGGGGGGVPSGPLQPAVSAETVAPAPTVAAAHGAAAAVPANGGGGAMGGGMGGMAPMHAAGGGQNREKKRNPAVAQDEDLYTEERPWTEAVIGNRRRRGTQDEKESQ